MVVECPFPKSVLNVTLTPNQGKYTFDPTSKVMVWDVGRIEPTRVPNIKGTVSASISYNHGHLKFRFNSSKARKTLEFYKILGMNFHYFSLSKHLCRFSSVLVG